MKEVRALSEWVALLSSPQEDEVERALDALAEALHAEDAAVHERAAQLLLEELARPESAAHAPILALLQSAWWPPTPRLAAPAMHAVVSALQQVAPDAPEVEEAALVLANVCREVPEQLPALEVALRHPHPAVRRAAAGAVGRVGDAALPLLPRLLSALADDDEVVADAALESLGSLAPLEPDTAAPALLSQVQHSHGARRYLALAALRGLLEEAHREGHPRPRGLEALAPALLRAVEDGEPAARLEAVALMGLVPAPGAEATQALERHLSDVSPDVAAYAAVSLLRLQGTHAEALAKLTSLLSSDAPERHVAALTALDGLETATLARVRPALEQAASQGPEHVREVAREMLDSLAVR